MTGGLIKDVDVCERFFLCCRIIIYIYIYIFDKVQNNNLMQNDSYTENDQWQEERMERIIERRIEVEKD